MADQERLTIKAARGELAGIGYSLRHVDGEFRVAPKGGDEAQQEACAYYTNDLADAVGTAKAERSRAVLRDGAALAYFDRALQSPDFTTEPQPQGRDPQTAREYPAERMLDRYAGIARSTDNDNER